MSECKRAATLRSVYSEMDEDRRRKLELLALELMDAHMVVERERAAVSVGATVEEGKNQDSGEAGAG